LQSHQHYNSALECSMRAPVVLVTLLTNHLSLMLICHSRVAIGHTWSADAEMNRKFWESMTTRMSAVVNVIIYVIIHVKYNLSYSLVFCWTLLRCSVLQYSPVIFQDDRVTGVNLHIFGLVALRTICIQLKERSNYLLCSFNWIDFQKIDCFNPIF